MSTENNPKGLKRKPSRVLKAMATVDRIEPPRPEDWTGEWRIEKHDPWRGDENREYFISTPSGSRDKVERPAGAERSLPIRVRTALELKLRFAAGISLLVFILVASASGVAQLAHRIISDVPVQNWREVELRITSIPAGAEVYIEGERRGATPLKSTEYCRARVVRVRVTTSGYTNWTWRGVCPTKGALQLTAHLQAL